jgi:hypothetical protein
MRNRNDRMTIKTGGKVLGKHDETPSVRLVNVLDTSALAWCDEAALVSVEKAGGRYVRWWLKRRTAAMTT